jgi:predicted Abi (CAAX) family protease
LKSRVITHCFSAAVSTIPDAEAWLHFVALLRLFTIIALPIGFQWEFLQIEVLRASWQTITGIITTSLVMPAVTEELFFRVLLLPQTTENLSTSALWIWLCISLSLFILYHPLNALSFALRGVETFSNSVFLVLAALLGVICSLAYIQSGSLWTPAMIH